MKFIYGILEKQFHSYYEKAAKAPGQTGAVLLTMVETRLDNVAFRTGFARPVVRLARLFLMVTSP